MTTPLPGRLHPPTLLWNVWGCRIDPGENACITRVNATNTRRQPVQTNTRRQSVQGHTGS